ncbi:hypothetical protein LUZ60_007620 [Juncus effusus]|nr:hypothetical protein LUZ60_007620 [Juncus effusus]
MNKPCKKLEKQTPRPSKPKPKTETELQMKLDKKKTRSPLSDLNRGTGTASCFRFLKPNSNSNPSSNSSSNSSSNYSFPHQRSRKLAHNSAPPKNPPKESKQKKQPKSKPAMTHQGFSVLTPEREKSGSTPPIQASISPEIACGSSMAPTPVCFAAGHVMTGVKDKRKCRPRGILTIGKENKIESVDDFDKSTVTSASVRWLSSPSKLTSGDSEPKTCSWLSSPSNIESGNSEPKTCSTKLQDEPFIDWPFSISPVKFEPPLQNSSSFRSNSGPFVQKTPSSNSSNSSTSPFSVIVKRASKSSRFKQVQLERETLSFTEIFESMNLSNNSENGASFEFGQNFPPLNSVDLNRFRNPNSISPELDKRISWREGLVSRIFEMGQTGQTDCCKWLSDCEDETEEDPFEVNTKIVRDRNGKCELTTIEDPFEVNTKISRDRNAKCKFAIEEDLFELKNTKIFRDQNAKCEFAESMYLKGEDELVSSDDSDWRFLYQNQLFDV